VLNFLRILFFIVIGWYAVKWLARWIAGGSREDRSGAGESREDKYESLTDQKIDDADYEDL
jgi:hypothetical protein